MCCVIGFILFLAVVISEAGYILTSNYVWAYSVSRMSEPDARIAIIQRYHEETLALELSGSYFPYTEEEVIAYGMNYVKNMVAPHKILLAVFLYPHQIVHVAGRILTPLLIITLIWYELWEAKRQDAYSMVYYLSKRN